MKDWLSIGQISTRTGVSARALRLYEQIGLLGTALRGENGYRYYRADQVLLVKKVCDLKTLGFSLKEIKAFLEGDAQFDAQTMQQLVERRLKHIVGEEKSLATRKSRLSSLLTSLRTKTKALSERERKYVMELYQRVRIVVTGVENLDATASYIETYLARAGQAAEIVQWRGPKSWSESGRPTVIVLPESQLADPAVGGLHADVVVVKNVGTYSPQMITRYLQLYAQVGPHMSTVLNADDRASLEIAKSALVQKGKIYYFSKNSGLKDQIEEIGGVVSDGEEMKVFGVNRAKGGRLNMKLPQILPHDQEVALLAALAAVMDLGMEAENLAL